MNGRERRLGMIKSILTHKRVQNQAQLLQLLHAEGIDATQATLSRDLKSLGVLKGAEGYTLSTAGPMPQTPRALADAMKAFMLSAHRAGTLVVVRTGPGRASALASEVDAAPPQGVVGTIAGDDTVFVAAATETAATRLVRQFKELAGAR